MKEKIAIIFSLVMVLGTIIGLSVYYIPYQTGFDLYYTSIKINGYRLYETSFKQNTSCDFEHDFVVLFEYENISYTTTDLISEEGCQKELYLLKGRELYTLQDALDEQIVSFNQLHQTNFGFPIIERTNLIEKDTVIKITLYYSQDSLDTDRLMVLNGENLSFLSNHFSKLLFTESGTLEETPSYYLDLYTESEVITFEIYPTEIVDSSTNQSVSLLDYSDEYQIDYQVFFNQNIE